MKGADSVILSEENLTKFSYENIVPKTKEHLDNFARNGYRTLCFSMKELNSLKQLLSLLVIETTSR